jgi:hypothetical protein
VEWGVAGRVSAVDVDGRVLEEDAHADQVSILTRDVKGSLSVARVVGPVDVQRYLLGHCEHLEPARRLLLEGLEKFDGFVVTCIVEELVVFLQSGLVH